MKLINLLITCGGGIYTKAIIESLKSSPSSFNLFLCDSSKKSVDFVNSLGYCIDEVESAENISSDCYINSISNVINKRKIDYILPMSDIEAIYLKNSSYKDITIAADQKECCMFKNKLSTLNYLDQKKLNQVFFFEIEHKNFKKQLSKLSEDKAYCLKPIIGRGSKGFLILSLPEVLLSMGIESSFNNHLTIDKLKSILKTNFSLFSSYLCMEYLIGDDYNIDISCDKGTLIDICIQRRDKPLHGPIIEGEVCLNLVIYDFIVEIVKRGNMSGVFNIELILKLESNKFQPVIYEINPRASAAISFTETVCPGFIGRAIRILKGENIPERTFKELRNVRIRRVWSNEFVY